MMGMLGHLWYVFSTPGTKTKLAARCRLLSSTDVIFTLGEEPQEPKMQLGKRRIQTPQEAKATISDCQVIDLLLVDHHEPSIISDCLLKGQA